MRILFISPYVPSLIRVRPFNFIRQLSNHHEITLISLVQGHLDSSALDEVRRYCTKMYAIPLSKAKSLINCCRRVLTPMPLQAAYTEWPSVRNFVWATANSGLFDLVHVEHIRGAHFAAGIQGLPKVYDSVDCITRLLKQSLGYRLSPIRRFITYEEIAKMRSYEPRITSMFDRVVITSRWDKRALERLVQIKQLARVGQRPPEITVVRNGVDTEYFQPTHGTTDPASILFAGKMSYFPNASAARDFYTGVFPIIRRVRPDARFKIVGSGPPSSIRALAGDPSVEVTGHVPDMRPHLGSAAVVVCPLNIGVGIQNKVLEAMAMAKPVVATSTACSGIPDAVNRRHLIRANNPLEIADAVIGLLADPQRRSELGANARRLVCREYSWGTSARRLEEVYIEAIEMHENRIAAAA